MGQLKPAYNLQHGVDSEYITWLDISPRPTDTRTLIPFLKDMELYLPFKYQEIVADAGYESEENYLFLEKTVSWPISSPRTMRFPKPENTVRISGGWKTWNMMRKRTVITVKMDRCWQCSTKREKRRPVDTGEPLPYIEATDAADALSKQTASRGTTAKHQWKTARKYCTISEKNERKTSGDVGADYQWLWYTASDEPEYPSRRKFCKHKEDMEFRRYLYRGMQM